MKRDTAGLLLHGGGTGGLGGTIGGGLADTDANADADADAAAPPPPPPPHVEPLSTLAGDSHVTIMRWDQKLFSPQEVERLRDLGELAVRGESRLTQLERAYINELHVLEGEATRSKVFEGSVIYTYIHDDIQVQRRHLARPIVSESGLRENYTDLSKGVLDIDGFKLARLGVTDGVLQQENAGGTRVRAAVPSELRSVAEQDDDILEEGAAAGGSRGRRGGGGGGGGSAADAGDGASVALRTTTEALDALDGSGTYQATASGGETSGGSSFSVLRWFKRLVTSHQFEGMARVPWARIVRKGATSRHLRCRVGLHARPPKDGARDGAVRGGGPSDCRAALGTGLPARVDAGGEPVHCARVRRRHVRHNAAAEPQRAGHAALRVGQGRHLGVRGAAHDGPAARVDAVAAPACGDGAEGHAQSRAAHQSRRHFLPARAQLRCVRAPPDPRHAAARPQLPDQEPLLHPPGRCRAWKVVGRGGVWAEHGRGAGSSCGT